MDKIKSLRQKWNKMPNPRSCCFCISLRTGILAWSYFKLILLYCSSVALFVTIILHFLFEKWPQVPEIVGMLLLSFFFVMDMVFTNALLIGVHSANTKIIKVCMYYSLITNIFLLVIWMYLSLEIFPKAGLDIVCTIAVHLILLIYLLMNVYVTVSIRSEKRRINGDFGTGGVEFVNQMVE